MIHLERVGHHLIEILERDRCKKINLSIHELHKFSGTMNVVSLLFTAGSFRIEADFDGEIDPFEKLIGYFCNQIGDWNFGVIYEIEHSDRSNYKKRNILYFTNPKIVLKWVFKQGLTQMKNQVAAKFKEFRKAQSAPVAVFNEGDLLEWAQTYSKDGLLSISVD